MHRPLWQIFLTLLLAGFVVRSGAVVAMALLSGAEPLLLGAALAQTAAAVAAMVGLWVGRRWVLGALGALWLAVVASAVVQTAVLGLRPFVTALGEIAVVTVAIGALFLALRHEFRSARRRGSETLGGTADDERARDPRLSPAQETQGADLEPPRSRDRASISERRR